MAVAREFSRSSTTTSPFNRIKNTRIDIVSSVRPIKYGENCREKTVKRQKFSGRELSFSKTLLCRSFFFFFLRTLYARFTLERFYCYSHFSNLDRVDGIMGAGKMDARTLPKPAHLARNPTHGWHRIDRITLVSRYIHTL